MSLVFHGSIDLIQVWVFREHETATLVWLIRLEPVPEFTRGDCIICIAQEFTILGRKDRLKVHCKNVVSSSKQYVLMDPVHLNLYVMEVINNGELYLEIERIRRILVHIYKNPHSNKAVQQSNVRKTEQAFKALLLAKEARLAEQKTTPNE